MTIEVIALIGFAAFIATSLIAKAVERRRDVLYGPYIEGRRVRPRFDGVMYLLFTRAIAELRPSAAQLGWKMRNVSCFASAIIG
jgi:hypothetical protein